jgi:hypothetical protein
MRRVLAKTVALVAALVLFGPQDRAVNASDRLVLLKDGFHWPHVSEMIEYGGRLWFVNSKKYVNHNSADIWSYDPVKGDTRYERHLFSQDAGSPVVHRGLLYWPLEDSRFSVGRGEFMVTNGLEWKWGLLPAGRAFHVHAMASSGDALYAAASAWTAKLQSSADGGTAWTELYEHPTPSRRVSRITSLAVLNGTLYGGLAASHERTGAKLLQWNGTTFVPFRRWPDRRAVPRLQIFKGWLYGVNIADDDGTVWRTSGSIVEKATGIFGTSIRGMAAGDDSLWVAVSNRGDGELWRSPDGERWSRYQRFPGVTLHGVGVFDGQVFVGGRTKNGGALYGPRPITETGSDLMDLPPLSLARLPDGGTASDTDTAAALERLRRDLADPQQYVSGLRERFLPLARSRDPVIGKALSDILRGPFPDASTTMFGSQRVSAAKIARWFILWAMAHNGHGRVPLELISAPWEAPQNDAEKYFDSPPAAAWAAAELGQKDDKTLATLIARLDRVGDPDWLKGDMIGALTVLTGQKFAYDIAAWKEWWAARAGR